MTKGAIISVILSLIAIFLYILVRFRNVAFSVGSVAALAVDTLFIIGMYSLCWGWVPFSLEIDQTFIGAILTAIGYSNTRMCLAARRIYEYCYVVSFSDIMPSSSFLHTLLAEHAVSDWSGEED